MGYSIDTIMENWIERTGKAQKGTSVFYNHDTIYSYGYHFPLAIYMEPDSLYPWVLANCDTYSVTTSGHQSSISYHVKRKGFTLVYAPFEALRKAGAYPWEVRLVDRIISPRIINNKVLDLFRDSCTLFSYKKYKYLVSDDIDIWGRKFVVRVPNRCKTVQDAIISLLPKDIIKAIQEEPKSVQTFGTLILQEVGRCCNKEKKRAILPMYSYDGSGYMGGDVVLIGKEHYASNWIKNYIGHDKIQSIRSQISLDKTKYYKISELKYVKRMVL